MRRLGGIFAALILMGSPMGMEAWAAPNPTNTAAQPNQAQWSWTGKVGSIDPQTGWLTLQDGSTFKLPAGYASQHALPHQGEQVRVIASYQGGQQVVRSIQPVS